MRIKWGHLCLVADLRFPLWTLAGIFDSLEVGSNPSPVWLALALEAHQNEAHNGQVLELRITDDKGETVNPGPQIQLGWFSLGPGYPMFSYQGVCLTGWRPPRPGVYRIVGEVDGTPLDGFVEFYGVPPVVLQAPPPEGLREHGFKVEWAHIAFNLTQQQGLFTIEQITEFHPALAQQPVFDGFYVAKITAGTEDGQDHRCHIELHGPDGGLLRRFDEGPLHFQTVGPGNLWATYVAVRLINVVFPAGVGEYGYELFVDGQRVDALDYWFVPPPVPPASSVPSKE